MPVFGPDAVAAAFPLGGIGTGNVSLGARGELRDWELMNRPDKGRVLPFTFFAIHTRDAAGESVTRVLESRLAPPHQFEQGYAASRLAGLPRLATASMKAEYPLVRFRFDDDVLPVDVSMTAFTPLVPLDVESSSIPGAVIRYSVTNPTSSAIAVTVVGSISNPVGALEPDFAYMPPPYEGSPRIDFRDTGSMRGLHLSNHGLDVRSLRYGSMSLATRDPQVTVKPEWLHGYWQDAAQLFWDDLREDGLLGPDDTGIHFAPHGLFQVEHGELQDEEVVDQLSKLRVGSLGIVHTIAPSATQQFEFLLTWHFPNRPRAWHGNVIKNDPHENEIVRNHYATRWDDAWSVAQHLADDIDELEPLTAAFTRALHSSTFDPAVVDAVAANVSTVRSTTCFVLEDGTFAAWEGSFDRVGSCEGTCTHVWNYAQTLAFLFPELERSARRTEFLLETDGLGRMAFRTNQIFGGPPWNAMQAGDGQLGTIVRLYRDWRFGGDDQFLKDCWPAALRAITYACDHWDTDDDGVLDVRLHNTYDIEFEGSEPLANIYFVAALAAGTRMAEAVGDEEAARLLRSKYERSRVAVDAALFNGTYFEQTGIDLDTSRYQYGKGVLSDQVLGQFLAHVAGLGHVISADHVRSALLSIVRHNFAEGFTRHHSVQRTYALNDESGLLLCSWPMGGRPRVPFFYCDEVWPGVEYQVAAHLIYEGLVEEGLRLVRAVRDRHDGRKRNPWSEAECGNHYARSLASWGLLLALSGASWDCRDGVLAFSPASPLPMRSFFSTDRAWGTVEITADQVQLQVTYGTLTLRGLRVAGREIPVDSVASLRGGDVLIRPF